MKPMQDKEFDQIFKENFADAEITPSASVWADIQKQLNPKKKRRLPVYWMAAASVLIALMSVILMQKQPTIRLQGKANAPKITETALTQIENPKGIITKQDDKITETKQDLELERFKASLIKDENHPVQEKELPKNLISVQPPELIAHLTLQKIEVKPLVMPKITATKQESVFLAQAENKEKTEINSLGKIVNFLVNKLDQREDKLIKLGNDKDGGTTVVALNLGIVKWSKK